MGRDERQEAEKQQTRCDENTANRAYLLYPNVNNVCLLINVCKDIVINLLVKLKVSLRGLTYRAVDYSDIIYSDSKN